MNPDNDCPECGAETESYLIEDIELPDRRTIQITVIACTECEWFTVTDWN